MTFDIHLHIDSQSPEGHALEAIVSRERVSPEEAIRHLLQQFAQAEPDNYDHIFTPELLTKLDAASAEAKAGGKTYSMDEVRTHFVEKREAWLANHPS